MGFLYVACQMDFPVKSISQLEVEEEIKAQK